LALDAARLVFDIFSVVAHFPHARALAPRGERGFTLIEAALATIIIGLGAVSMMQLFSVCTRDNAAGAHMTTALLLATNAQEMMASLAFKDPEYGNTYFGPEPGETLASYDDLDDFDLQTFHPPLDASRQPITQLAQYSQLITVMPVYPYQPSANTNETTPSIPKTTYTGAVRVRVRILYRLQPASVPEEVYRLSWVRLDN
jgi:type II secretory pathway pseudopilin PulG